MWTCGLGGSGDCAETVREWNAIRISGISARAMFAGEVRRDFGFTNIFWLFSALSSSTRLDSRGQLSSYESLVPDCKGWVFLHKNLGRIELVLDPVEHLSGSPGSLSAGHAVNADQEQKLGVIGWD